MTKLTIKAIECPKCHCGQSKIKFYKVMVDYGTLSTGISCKRCKNSLELQEDTGFYDSHNELEVNVASILGRELLKRYWQDLKEWLVIEEGEYE